jgi:hypothetical protein
MHAASGGGYHSGSSSCSSSLSLSLSAAPRLADSCWPGMRLGTPPSTSSPCWVGSSGSSQLICSPFRRAAKPETRRRVPQRLALLMLFDPVSPATLLVTPVVMTVTGGRPRGATGHRTAAASRRDGGALANTVARGLGARCGRPDAACRRLRPAGCPTARSRPAGTRTPNPRTKRIKR